LCGRESGGAGMVVERRGTLGKQRAQTKGARLCARTHAPALRHRPSLAGAAIEAAAQTGAVKAALALLREEEAGATMGS